MSGTSHQLTANALNSLFGTSQCVVRHRQQYGWYALNSAGVMYGHSRLAQYGNPQPRRRHG
jgi:hypothetical protein